jgi:uncharacterized membrane protein
MNEPSPDHQEFSHSARADERAVFDHLQALERDIATAIREAAVLASLQVDRARVWARESMWTLGMVAVSALAILALVVLAIVRIMAGICDGLTQWFGMPWAGSLGGGLIGLGIAILALRGVRRSMSEANLRRMREKYDGTLPSTKE